uniref:Uncharacterized protein n=3 Tax=Enterobacterales TaxID=91347 RepID=L7ZBF9_CITFR|nr:hypothetical protein [Citrobacter freundii]
MFDLALPCVNSVCSEFDVMYGLIMNGFLGQSLVLIFTGAGLMLCCVIPSVLLTLRQILNADSHALSASVSEPAVVLYSAGVTNLKLFFVYAVVCPVYPELSGLVLVVVSGMAIITNAIHSVWKCRLIIRLIESGLIQQSAPHHRRYAKKLTRQHDNLRCLAALFWLMKNK